MSEWIEIRNLDGTPYVPPPPVNDPAIVAMWAEKIKAYMLWEREVGERVVEAMFNAADV